MGRRDLLRIEMRVEVEYKTFDQFYREYTKNISKGGLFIKSERIWPPQTALEISLKLPELEQTLNLVGEVVHVIEPELAKAHGWESGMGVQFVDFEEGAHQALCKYVASKHKQDPTVRPSDRRVHERKQVRIKVRFPNVDVLRNDYARDISRGGIFIQTLKPRKVGDKFEIVLVHPISQKELSLRGEVVRVTVEDPQQPELLAGMGIKFVELDEGDAAHIQKFLDFNNPSGY